MGPDCRHASQESAQVIAEKPDPTPGNATSVTSPAPIRGFLLLAMTRPNAFLLQYSALALQMDRSRPERCMQKRSDQQTTRHLNRSHLRQDQTRQPQPRCGVAGAKESI